MRKPRRKRSKRVRTMRLWSWSEVAKAVPYLHSIIGSLREHWLDILNVQRRIDQAAAQHGPAKRQQILDSHAHQDERERAQAKFDDALEELNQVEAYLLDPVRGSALLPFRKGDELAWYVFDHFTPSGVVGWRFHNDPIEECRPLETMEEAITKDAATN